MAAHHFQDFWDHSVLWDWVTDGLMACFCLVLRLPVRGRYETLRSLAGLHGLGMLLL